MFQNNSAMAQQSIDPQLLQMLMMQHQQQQPQQPQQTGPQIPVPQNGQGMPYMPAMPQAQQQQSLGQSVMGGGMDIMQLLKMLKGGGGMFGSLGGAANPNDFNYGPIPGLGG